MAKDALSVRDFRVRIMHGAGTCLKSWRQFGFKGLKRVDQVKFPIAGD
jgi:hypothetical protein